MEETLDPDAAALIALVDKAGRPPPWQQPLDQARADFARLMRRGAGAPPPMPVEDLAESPVPVRLYRPPSGVAGPARPLLVWFHGGGMVMGDLDCYDGLCRHVAAASGWLVASVGYRLAPEHIFPIGFEDAWTGLAWLAGAAERLGADPARIGVGGDSAGGGLAAACCLRARDLGGPRLALQVLIYPGLDARRTGGSVELNGEGYLLSRDMIGWFQAAYAGGTNGRDWRLSPGLATDLSGLPPAVVVAAGFDPLWDEDVRFVRALRLAGGAATLLPYARQVHGFFAWPGLIGEAATAIAAIGGLLRRAAEA